MIKMFIFQTVYCKQQQKQTNITTDLFLTEHFFKVI